MLHFFNDLRRDGSPSRDLPQEFRYLLDGVGAAVSQKQDSYFRCGIQGKTSLNALGI